MDEKRAYQRIKDLSLLLDDAYTIPGTSIRIGLDGLIGLVPGIGDAVTTALGGYIILQAHKLGAPWYILSRMTFNVLADGVVGAVPLVGDALDIAWKANRANLKILTRWLERREQAAPAIAAPAHK